MGLYKKGKNWFIDYYVHGRRKREKVGVNKQFAQLVLEKRKVQIAEGKFLDIKKGERVRFDEIAEDFLNYSRVNKSSYQRDVTSVKNFSPSFSGKRLVEITPFLIEQYKSKRLTEGRKPATVNRELACLKTMFSWAIKNNKATENPVKQVNLLKEDNVRTRYLSEDEIRRLLDTCTECLRRIVICALLTGMRRGEILNLTWDDVNLQQGVILVKHTKTGKMREIPISGLLEKVVLECHQNTDGVYVFCDEQGRHYTRIDRLFNRILNQANIQGFRFHDLRHTAASYMVMLGIDLTTVKEILGHQNLDMTLRYAHLSPIHKRQAMEILSGRMDAFWTPEKDTSDDSGVGYQVRKRPDEKLKDRR
jgi:site-specific recombinase XerD